MARRGTVAIVAAVVIVVIGGGIGSALALTGGAGNVSGGPRHGISAAVAGASGTAPATSSAGGAGSAPGGRASSGPTTSVAPATSTTTAPVARPANVPTTAPAPAGNPPTGAPTNSGDYGSRQVSLVLSDSWPGQHAQPPESAPGPGEAVTFTAVLGGGTLAPEPTGTMTFVVDGNLAACSPVAVSNGRASCTVVLGSGGNPHQIAARYSGDANYEPVTSDMFSQATSS